MGKKAHESEGMGVGGMYGKVWRKEKREMLQFNLKIIKKKKKISNGIQKCSCLKTEKITCMFLISVYRF